MNVTKVMLAAFPVFTTAHCASPQAQSTKPWAPVTYHGLVMGKSTRADVLSILGKPKWAGKEPDTGIPIMSFDVSDPVPPCALGGFWAKKSPPKELFASEALALYKIEGDQ